MLRFALAALAAGLIALLAGCDQYGAPTAPGSTTAQIRLINAAPELGDATLMLNGAAVEHDLGYPGASAYLELQALQQHAIAVRDTNGTIVGQLNFSPLRGSQSSVLVYGDAVSRQVALLPDKETPAPDGSFHVRIVHLAKALPENGVDVYFSQAPGSVAGLQPVEQNLPFEFLTQYFVLPAGSYHVLATPSQAQTVVISGGETTFESAGVYTVFLVEAPGGGEPYATLVVKH